MQSDTFIKKLIIRVIQYQLPVHNCATLAVIHVVVSQLAKAKNFI